MTIDARGISDDFAEEVDTIDAPALGEVGVLADGEEESRCLETRRRSSRTYYMSAQSHVQKAASIPPEDTFDQGSVYLHCGPVLRLG